MPGSLSNSSREAWLMETRGAASEGGEKFEVCAPEAEARRGSLTQEALAAATQHRMIQPKLLRRRSRFKGESCYRQRVSDVCRASVQNARSLKFSETCNAKKREIHRLFHSFCGKVVATLSREKDRRPRENQHERTGRKEMMNDECGMMNYKKLVAFHSSLSILHSSLSSVLPIRVNNLLNPLPASRPSARPFRMPG